MAMTASNSSGLRESVPVTKEGEYINVPRKLDNLALRVLHVHRTMLALHGHQTLEKGFHEYLGALFRESHEYRVLWQSSYLMGLKYKVEEYIKEASLYLDQNDRACFERDLYIFKRAQLIQR
jgi:hypothetical protein